MQTSERAPQALAERHPSLPYVLPFAVFVAFLAAGSQLAVLGPFEHILRVVILSGVLYFSRHVIDLRLRYLVGSVALGVVVFAIWIGPDLLIPGYRSHWLFQNAVMGSLRSSLSPDDHGNALVLLLRSFRAIALVPVIEELFWRAWLMRYIASSDFRRIPLGAYHATAFWVTALLFASEHGPYWEVGLAAGILYNWWMVRTKSLGDCILAHAVTNACLCLFVILTGRWEYWL